MLHNIKEWLKRFPIFHRAAQRLRHKLLSYKLNPSYWIRKIIKNPTATVVQIGSNDGCFGDPIRNVILKRKNWKALFVEPVPYLYKRLCENYGDNKRFRFINAAVNEGVAADFYWVNPSANLHIKNLPPWYDQLGSFDREHILKHLNGVLEPYIEKTIIRGITLSELFSTGNIKKIDLLHIDTEGYDWKILSQLNLERYTPTMIIYEHNHLTDAEKIRSIEHLNDVYTMYSIGRDIIAIHKSIDINKYSFLRKFKGHKINA